MSDIKYVYPLIHNKVTPPHYVTPTLRRARLLDWLNAAANCRAMVIAADAGYGKTTLLWQWEREAEFPCYWYKLDRNDRDWSLHISYLIEAISQRHAGFGKRAHSMLQQLGGPGSSRPGVAAYLLAEMYDRLTEPCTFIIDDWQFVASVTEVRGLWNQILRDAPPTCRFVFLSRAKPQLQFARFKTHAGYAELRTDALRFTDREIDELFRDIYNDPLDPSELTELERRTEGWAASLQLVEVSLRERPTPEERRAFISSITATTDSDLFSFLAEEVLDQQNEQTRNFLLSTSILHQITPELAERLAGVPSGARMLAELEQRGLFTYRLDVQEARYRYHGLFRDFLERRLTGERSEGEVVGLHIHAASYYETHEQWPQAIHHYLKAGLQPQAARLIARYGEDVVAEGRLGLVDEWLPQLPAKTVRDNARLSLLYGEACGIRGELQEALEALQRSRTFFSRKGDRRLEALACLKLSSILQASGAVADAVVAAEEGMALAPETDERLRLRLRGNLAVTSTYATQSVSAVLAEVTKLVDQAAGLGLDHYAAIALHNLGNLQRSLGDLDGSIASLRAATRFWELQPSNPYSDNMDLVETLLVRNELPEAERAAERGVASTRPWGRANAEATLGLASVRLHQGRIDEAGRLVAPIAEKADALGCNKTAVLLVLGDCCLLAPDDLDRTRHLLSRLTGEAMDPRFEGDVAALTAALEHSLGECSGRCESASKVVDEWEARGQRFETVKRRWLVAGATAEHAASGHATGIVHAALGTVLISGQGPYLKAFLRPALRLAKQIASTDEGAATLGNLVEIDAEHWRPAAAAALAFATSAGRTLLLSALERDGGAEIVSMLGGVRGRDVEDLRARLIRRHAARVHIRTFGSLRVRRVGSDEESQISRPRQRGLLGLLAARMDNPPSREQLIEALWPEADPADGVNSLNQSVFQLRRFIDPNYADGASPQYVTSSTDGVRLDPLLVSTDLQEFRLLAKVLAAGTAPDMRSAAESLLALIVGEFLSDLAYDDWATHYRMAVHAEVHRALMALTNGAWLTSNPDLGLRAASALAGLDPYDEQAHLAMARCLQAMGRTEAARKAVAGFIHRLRTEVGEEPETDFSPYARGSTGSQI